MAKQAAATLGCELRLSAEDPPLRHGGLYGPQRGECQGQGGGIFDDMIATGAPWLRQ